jgi:putative pyruvate formate lyase activating enzyme
LRPAKVASWNVHHGEEPPISGTGGSGTIFFSYCTARCLFCQNYPISQLGVGETVTDERLGGLMLELQKRGCHNINLVTPTHYVPQIMGAVEAAARRGLSIPIVYNTSGYDRVDTLRLLDGIVDIYLPDAKYADDAVARRLSGFVGYVERNRAALLEMRRQVGSQLTCDEDGIARRGMVVRHLILPHGLAQTAEVLRWIADALGRDTYISLMSQYFPAHEATSEPELNRRLSRHEYLAALRAFSEAGLENGWKQPTPSRLY